RQSRQRERQDHCRHPGRPRGQAGQDRRRRLARPQGGRSLPARLPHARWRDRARGVILPSLREAGATGMTGATGGSSRGSVLGVLFRVLGRRPFIVFGLVSGLVVFLLAAVTITSRYAMQRYVADQVERVPWDLSIYQTAEVPLADQLRDSIGRVAGVAAAERLVFLRTIPPYSMQPTIDGQQLRSPWISLLTAT